MIQVQTQESPEVLEEVFETECHRCLSNLYLEIERGDADMSLHFRLSLENLLESANLGDMMEKWWMEEFYKLPNYWQF